MGRATKPDLLGTWEAVDAWLERFFSPEYRGAFPDSEGRSLVASWFMLHWTGFTSNPMCREFGYHKILDHYLTRWGWAIRRYGDDVQWHYHHPAPSGAANEWNREWSNSQEYENILNRLILDRGIYPVVYRAGGTIESNESSAWLEQWIPFDFSNRAGVSLDRIEADGRQMTDLVDWRGAPADWSAYHPHQEDYRRPGPMRRVIARSVDLLSDVHTLTEDEITAAFERADAGQETVLSVFDHDYRDRAEAIRDLLMAPVSRIARRFPRVRWRYAAATDAIRRLTGRTVTHGPAFATVEEDRHFVITSTKPLVGIQPWIVVRHGTSYRRLDATIDDAQRWRIRCTDIPPASLLAVAGTDECGNTCCVQKGITR